MERDIVREASFSIPLRTIDIPASSISDCRGALDEDTPFDPGIGAMIVDPSDIAFFRVR